MTTSGAVKVLRDRKKSLAEWISWCGILFRIMNILYKRVIMYGGCFDEGTKTQKYEKH